MKIASRNLLKSLNPQPYAYTRGGKDPYSFSGGVDLCGQLDEPCMVETRGDRENLLLEGGDWLVLRGDLSVLDGIPEDVFRSIYRPIGSWPSYPPGTPMQGLLLHLTEEE